VVVHRLNFYVLCKKRLLTRGRETNAVSNCHFGALKIQDVKNLDARMTDQKGEIARRETAAHENGVGLSHMQQSGENAIGRKRKT